MEITNNQIIAMQSDKALSPPRKEQEEYDTSSESQKTVPSSEGSAVILPPEDYSNLSVKNSNDNSKNEDLTEKMLEKTKEEEKKAEDTNQKKPHSIVANTVIQFKLVEVKDKNTGETSKELVILLLDKKSGEIVRRIPPEEFFDPYNK